jgi:hypothetical protein
VNCYVMPPPAKMNHKSDSCGPSTSRQTCSHPLFCMIVFILSRVVFLRPSRPRGSRSLSLGGNNFSRFLIFSAVNRKSFDSVARVLTYVITWPTQEQGSHCSSYFLIHLCTFQQCFAIHAKIIHQNLLIVPYSGFPAGTLDVGKLPQNFDIPDSATDSIIFLLRILLCLTQRKA